MRENFAQINSQYLGVKKFLKFNHTWNFEIDVHENFWAKNSQKLFLF